MCNRTVSVSLFTSLLPHCIYSPSSVVHTRVPFTRCITYVFCGSCARRNDVRTQIQGVRQRRNSRHCECLGNRQRGVARHRLICVQRSENSRRVARVGDVDGATPERNLRRGCPEHVCSGPSGPSDIAAVHNEVSGHRRNSRHCERLGNRHGTVHRGGTPGLPKVDRSVSNRNGARSRGQNL